MTENLKMKMVKKIAGMKQVGYRGRRKEWEGLTGEEGKGQYGHSNTE